MIRKFVDLNFSIITKNINKTVYISRNINPNKFISINKFSYAENNTPKIIKVIKDENNQNKIIYKNFDESEIGKKDSKAELKEKDTFINKERKNLKLKIFGDTKIELNAVSESKFQNAQREEKNFNIFENLESNSREETRDEMHTEEVRENLLNYNSFFSDYCRVYVKAGDGGNGSISVLKGPMFDQGIIFFNKNS